MTHSLKKKIKSVAGDIILVLIGIVATVAILYWMLDIYTTHPMYTGV